MLRNNMPLRSWRLTHPSNPYRLDFAGAHPFVLSGGWPTLSQLAFVVPTIPGTPARIIPLDHSSIPAPVFAGAPSFAAFAKGGCFRCWFRFRFRFWFRFSVLVPRSTPNPSTHPAYTNSLPHTDKTGNYSTPTVS